MAEHRTSRLKIYGDGVEVEKLINSRYRVIVRCMPQNKLEDWYYTNIGNTFAEFATEMDDEIKVDGVAKGWQGVTEMPYSNAKLIAMEMGYTQTGDYVVTFIYETLTASWVSSEADVVGATENGLRTLTKTQVAAPGTTVPYDEDDVGVETITNGGKTLYLAGLDDVSDERMSRFITKWAEAGQLSYGFSYDLDGLKTNRYRFLGVEGSTDGLIVDRGTGNWEGFQTIDITTQTKTDGTAFSSGDVVETFGVKYPFQYPGVAQCKFQSTGTGRGVYYLDLDPSITVDVDATVEVSYQTSSSIGVFPDDPGNTGNPMPYWNPTSWAKFTAFWLTNNLEPTSVVKGLNGYRVGASSSQTYSGDLSQVAFLGRFVYATGEYFATMTLTGGPVDPSGNTYVIARPKVEPAFVAADGTKWYKQTIIYATV